MDILQKPSFKRVYKKLHDNQRPAVNNAIKDLINDPTIGEEKKGDLVGIRVHKFQIQNQLYLLAYTFDPDTMTLILLGVHENFYKELKKTTWDILVFSGFFVIPYYT